MIEVKKDANVRSFLPVDPCHPLSRQTEMGNGRKKIGAKAARILRLST